MLKDIVIGEAYDKDGYLAEKKAFHLAYKNLFIDKNVKLNIVY